MLARKPRQVQIVAECRAYPANLVRRYLLPLARAPKHDPTIRPTLDHLLGGRVTEDRIVDGFDRIGTAVDDLVPLFDEEGLQILLEGEARVVRTHRDPHGFPQSRISE